MHDMHIVVSARSYMDVTTIDIEITTNGRRYHHKEIKPTKVYESVFNVVWNSMGNRIIECMKEE